MPEHVHGGRSGPLASPGDPSTTSPEPSASPLHAWAAARRDPRSYPGTHPDGSFVLLDHLVHPLVIQQDADLWHARVPGLGALEAVLAERHLPSLADRVPVLAYGGNRSPGTLALKLDHYAYRSPGDGTVLPVLGARIRGFDAVAGGLSGQGYLYADLFRSEKTAATVLDAHVLLLDQDQLRVLHDSEGVRESYYAAAWVPGVRVAGLTSPVKAVVYVGRRPVWRSPVHRTPVAFSTIRAQGRQLPEYSTGGMLAHALESLDLVAPVRSIVCAQHTMDESAPDAAAVADELMKYLNGQWWYRQHTEEPRLLACSQLEEVLVSRLRQSAEDVAPADTLGPAGRVLGADDAYQVTVDRQLGGHP
jgi:hypothetical protein